MAWAGDSAQLDGDLFEETVQAIWSAAGRYWPEMPATASCRILLAQMRVESDFQASSVDGPAWGLLQVTPGQDSNELDLFQQHATVSHHRFSWQAGAVSRPQQQPGPASGALTNYQSSSPLNARALSRHDLLRPWINVHVAVWMQSNLARTGSNDPYDWKAIARLSKKAAQEAAGRSSSSGESSQSRRRSTAAAASKLAQYLHATRLPYTMETALGSWVAGPATDGEGSYRGSGDTESAAYMSSVLDGVRMLYGNQRLTRAFFSKYSVHPGLVDYHV